MEGFDDDHPAAAAGASARRGRCFVAVGLGPRALGCGRGHGEPLADEVDVAGANGAGEEAVVADAVEAATP